MKGPLSDCAHTVVRCTSPDYREYPGSQKPRRDRILIGGCSHLHRWCLNISFAASNWLLLLRVSALWGRKRAVIWPLYFCYFALYVVISVIVGLAVARMSSESSLYFFGQAVLWWESGGVCTWADLDQNAWRTIQLLGRACSQNEYRPT